MPQCLDEAPPEISCADYATVLVEPGAKAHVNPASYVSQGLVSATDTTTTTSPNITHGPASEFEVLISPPHYHTITYVATDASGNWPAAPVRYATYPWIATVTQG